MLLFILKLSVVHRVHLLYGELLFPILFALVLVSNLYKKIWILRFVAWKRWGRRDNSDRGLKSLGKWYSWRRWTRWCNWSWGKIIMSSYFARIYPKISTFLYLPKTWFYAAIFWNLMFRVAGFCGHILIILLRHTWWFILLYLLYFWWFQAEAGLLMLSIKGCP